jgi:ABC-type oligopeptide transport system substrate-binding subunit
VNAWGKTLPADAAPLDKQVWRTVGIEGKHFDTMRNEYEGFAYEQTIEQLALMDQNGVWQPAAADKWEVSADGLTWTFYLRKNAKWSDGTPVTADDWIYSWQRYEDPKMANVYAHFLFGIKNAEKVNKGELPMSELGVKKIDDYTVAVTTGQPIPYFMFTLNWHTAPVPRHMVEKYGNAWADKPETAPSNGPWKISEWNRGQNVIFTPNTYYNGPWKPNIEKMIMTIVPQNFAGQLQMYQAGDMDGGVGLRGDPLAQAMADATLKSQMIYGVAPQSSYLYMNPSMPPFDKAEARQAIMHAVDQEAIARDVMRGTYKAIYGLLPWDFPCANQTDAKLKEIQKLDVAMAKDLLAKAGYPDGKGFPDLILYTRGGEFVREAEAVQAMLKQNLGITVKTQDIERALFSTMRGKNEVAFWYGRWGADFIDPSNFADFWPDKPFPGFTNAEYKKLIDQARSMQTGPDRCKLYNDAEKILAADGIAKFMANPYQGTLYKSYVGGLPLNKDGTFGPYNQIIMQSIYIKK